MLLSSRIVIIGRCFNKLLHSASLRAVSSCSGALLASCLHSVLAEEMQASQFDSGGSRMRVANIAVSDQFGVAPEASFVHRIVNTRPDGPEVTPQLLLSPDSSGIVKTLGERCKSRPCDGRNFICW